MGSAAQTRRCFAESAGGYGINLDTAPQLVADLRAGADRYDIAIDAAIRAGRVVAPGQDKVSQTAAANVKAMSQDVRDWLRARQRELREAADALEAQLKAYQRVEGINIPPAAKWT